MGLCGADRRVRSVESESLLPVRVTRSDVLTDFRTSWRTQDRERLRGDGLVARTEGLVARTEGLVARALLDSGGLSVIVITAAGLNRFADLVTRTSLLDDSLLLVDFFFLLAFSSDPVLLELSLEVLSFLAEVSGLGRDGCWLGGLLENVMTSFWMTGLGIRL